MLVCSPIYLVVVEPDRTFLELLMAVTIGTLVCWAIQIFFFSFFKNKNYSNWQYLLFLLILIVVIVNFTNPNITSTNKVFSDSSETIVFLFRFALASSINFMIFLILDLVYTQERRIRLIEENASLKYSNIESEYKLLKAQINPHFLFNALNISKSLIKTHPENAEKYIVQLSEFLRRSINNQQKSVTLQKELDNCEQYIRLQKMRFENAFTYSVDVRERHLDKKLPFYALITLLENAFKHNSFEEDNPLLISIKTRDDYIQVRNNLKIKNGVVSTHTGLSNLNQRSKLLSGFEIIIDNDGQYFSVQIKLLAP